MKYYVPFRTLRSDIPSITLHRNSENFDTEDTRNTSNDVFFEEAYKKTRDKFSAPPEAMIFDNSLIVIQEVKEIFKNNVSIQPATFIDNDNKYHEKYWLIKPSTYYSAINLEKSDYEITFILDSNEPLFNTYEFEKIVTFKEKKNSPAIFIDTYLKLLVIDESILEEFKKQKISGLSFLNIEAFKFSKMFQENDDIISI
ncbi:imm11 family protein [Neptunomonas phycophila]|uniref:imm11 family protein n=1 Tax=Neptunomonas phycophila TaxID=1572645 RepID=UPI001BEB800C|nr:DUF1629 domain-containing protein [Neptunomonas phycophila]MBT3146680.1 hypothetical protein [Neptunomonas phycophila]